MFAAAGPKAELRPEWVEANGGEEETRGLCAHIEQGPHAHGLMMLSIGAHDAAEDGRFAAGSVEQATPACALAPLGVILEVDLVNCGVKVQGG